MKTVKVTPDNIISIINVDFDDFRDLQKAVGGHFETVSTKTLYETFKMPMIMLPEKIRHISTEFIRKTSDGQIGHSMDSGPEQKEKDCKLKRLRSWLLNSLSIHTSRTEAG